MVYSRRCIFQILQYAIVLSQVAGLEFVFERQLVYPLSLIWIHAFVALITARISSLVINSVQEKGYSCCPDRSLSLPVFTLESALETASGLLDVCLQICVVQCIFHTRSITQPFIFYYLFDIVTYLLGAAYLRFRPASWLSVVGTVVGPIIFILPFLAPIVWGERKVNPKVLYIEYVTALAYIAKRILDGILGSNSPDSERKTQWSRSFTVFILLIITTIITAVSAESELLIERRGFQKLVTEFPFALLVPSILIGIFNSLEHTRTCTEENEPPKYSDSRIDYALARGTMDLVTVFLTTYMLFLQTPSWVQIISYGCLALIVTFITFLLDRLVPIKALTVTTSDGRLENTDDRDLEVVQKLLANEEVGASRKKRTAKAGYDGFNLKIWIFGLSLFLTKVLLETQNTRNHYVDPIALSEPSGAAFTPSRSFDIVVSYFKEDLDGLRDFIQSVKVIPQIKDLAPNVIIYTKNDMSDMEHIKAITGANEVVMLPNRGREGGTYLHHITERWEDLANHTLFTQAEPHSAGRLVGRLNDYFDPHRTGMLDLGYRELRGCNCLTCIDEFGWYDEVNFIPDLMAQAHRIQCDENTRVSISYKGQFLVSARRIRALRKSIYENINEKLVGESRIEIGGNMDSPDAPFFGYTLERSWNILFQCADLTGTRDMCPGLTTTSVPFGDLQHPKPEDCSCLDN